MRSSATTRWMRRSGCAGSEPESSGCAPQKLLRQPLPRRQVVKLQARVRDGDAGDEDRSARRAPGGEGQRLVCAHPFGIDVDQAVVRDVERIGEFAEESGDAG